MLAAGRAGAIAGSDGSTAAVRDKATAPWRSTANRNNVRWADTTTEDSVVDANMPYCDSDGEALDMVAELDVSVTDDTIGPAWRRVMQPSRNALKDVNDAALGALPRQ